MSEPKKLRFSDMFLLYSYFTFFSTFSLIFLCTFYSPITQKKTGDVVNVRPLQNIIFILFSVKIQNGFYCPICLATSAAKSSSFFSIPSPTSNLTISTTFIALPTSLATLSTYCATVISPFFTNF